MARFLTTIIQGMSVQAHDGASSRELRAIAAFATEELAGYRLR